MVIYSNTAAQTLTTGQSLTLAKTTGCQCNCSVNPTNGSSIKGSGVFVVAFTGNISGATAGAPVQLSLAINGAVIPGSRMVATPAVAGNVNNVAAVTGFTGYGCCNGTTITVVNTGANPVTVEAKASLVVFKDR